MVLPSDLLILLDAVRAEDDRRLGEDGLRLGERVAVAAVEGPDDLARQLEVGRLVLADRHERRLVDDDVGGLQDRVGEQAVVDVVGLVALLLLVGRRPLQPADRRDRREQPGELGVPRADGSGRTACSGPDRARGRAARPPSRASARAARRRRGCSSARGSRRCSRSPRTRTAARRSSGSRPGRCRGGRPRTAGCPRRSAAARGRRRPRRGGAGPSSVVMVGECSGPALTGAGRRPRRVGYHSADVATRPTPVDERRPRCASPCSARGPSAREVVRALLDRPRRARAGRRRGARPGRRRASATSSRGASPRACPPSSLTDAPAHLVADDRDRRHRRADGRRRARPHADRGRAVDGQERRHRQQARHRPPRPGARGDRPADRRGAAVRGGGRRRDPGPRPARARPRGEPDRARPGHRQRHDQLHPERDDRRDGAARLRRRRSPRPSGSATRRPTRPATSRATTPSNKLVILARLAFDRWLDPACDPDAARTAPAARRGPASPASRLDDQRRAPRAAGRIIRLVAAAARSTDDGDLGRGPADRAAARLGARADGRRAQPDRGRRACRSAASAFDGPGAGGAATSSAVLGDLDRDRPRSRARPGVRVRAAAARPSADRGRPRRVSDASSTTASGVRYPDR